MTRHKTIAFILAGGRKPSLDVLSRKRAKAAIPFGGIYRVIDFCLSNMMHSEISHVGVLTQYRPESLMDHIGEGEAWDMNGRSRGIKIMPPYQRQHDSDWYKGTGDAIYQNLNFIHDHHPEQILITSGDHIYHMNYQHLLHWHHERNADITIVTRRMPKAAGGAFGMVRIGDDLRITEYQEKPESVKFQDISLGIYVFDTEVLVPLLIDDAASESSHDMGRDIIAPFIAKYRVFAYPFDEPWFYLGNIRDYWKANMELLNARPVIALQEWGVETNLFEANMANLPPTRFRGLGSVTNSLIANGCFIEGKVVNSIIFPEVTIGRDCLIENSILMNGVQVGNNTHLNEVIADKKVVFAGDTVVGVGPDTPNDFLPMYFDTGITVLGKSVKVSKGTRIGRNVLIYESLNTAGGIITSGSTIGGHL